MSISYASQPCLRPRLTKADQLYPGNLRYSTWRFPASISLLIPAFSLLRVHSSLSVLLRPFKMLLYQCITAFLQLRCCVSAPDILAQDLSTSELLRTLSMYGCFWSQHPSCSRNPTSFSTSPFGTLAVGLGSFPFDYPTYLSLTPVHHLYGIRSLIFFGRL